MNKRSRQDVLSYRPRITKQLFDDTKLTYVIELHRIIVHLIFEFVLVEGLLPGSFRLCVSRGKDQGGERFETWLPTRIKIQSDEKDCYKNSSDQNRLLFSMSNHEASTRPSNLCTHRRQSKYKMRDITSRLKNTCSFPIHRSFSEFFGKLRFIFVDSTQSFSHQVVAIPKKKMAVR